MLLITILANIQRLIMIIIIMIRIKKYTMIIISGTPAGSPPGRPGRRRPGAWGAR